MFKIPTYDDLEKKESELNNERQGYKNNLFLKRKQLDIDEEISEEKKSKPEERVVEPKTSITTTNEITEISKDNDEDDDEDLLNFINENKDLIEKPMLITNETENKAKDVEQEAKKQESFKNHNVQTTSTISTGSSMISGSLTVSSKQRGNLVLKHIKNVPWKYCDQLTPDFQMGT